MNILKKALPADSSSAGTFPMFKAQESMLIMINLILMASVLLLQLAFQSLLGWPTSTILLLFGLRFLMQTGELQWLSAREVPLSARSQYVYGRFSVLMHLSFAAAVSLVSSKEDTHYAVLLILPVIASGFRMSLQGTLFIAGGASFVCLVEVWDFSRRSGPQSVTEYFEAFGTVLIFFLVGSVVWLLASSLRKERDRLGNTMAELERTRDKLVQQEKLAALGRLSSGIAHEIRNPIAMISSSLAMARGADADHRLTEEMLDIATQEAQRLEHFTSEFLTYARGIQPRTEATSAATIIHYVTDLSRARAAEKEVGIACIIERDETVHVEPFQLHQALLNLVANAIDAAPPGSDVRIGLKKSPDGGHVFYVQNGGPSIEDSVVPQLFEPFFTTKPSGTGLGLAIVQKIAEAHNGFLQLEENKPGHVCFVLWIPDPSQATA